MTTMETTTVDDVPEQTCNSTLATPPLPSPKDTASSPLSPPTIVDGAPSTLPTTIDGAPPTLPNRMEGGTGPEETMKELSKDYSLSLGMEFELEEDAYDKEGKREKANRSLVVEQPRRETRTKCIAFMYIRRIREAQALNIELAVDSGLSVKASHDLISAQSRWRENVGFTLDDHRSYLHARRQRSLQYGEAGALLGYFQTRAAENPYFFYDVQLDIEENITNIFWADHEMITDYGLFGDAVSFDTTFQTNKECRPLAIFTSFNYFRMTTIFGAALLYDETSESFEWLFKPFTHFDRLVMEKQNNEIDSIFDSREKLPKQKLKKSPMLIQVAQFYTPPLFDLFHDEVDLSLSCKVKQHHEFEGEFKCVIGLHGNKSLESQCGGSIEFLVSGSVELDEFGDNICREVYCTCRKFENFGILCGHAIKGLDRMSVMEIPESYILCRWRLDAKACASKDNKVSVEEDDPKFAKAAH
ncbi:hypothetical protein RHSIM_Rhsim02G0129500 [Rhododendron simsii]|uniref:SWIM-type domain-containing protein n=1 Tax=Rhododendron simsii TaxID=118357 RepID=A0A834LVN8_RHOSS|nr:hypothetical protein RHSIM_Rhsim02G0129500 [Rhododendron simsii]